MTTTVCPACNTEPAHHGAPCNACWRRCRHQLADFTWLWHQLDITRLRLDKLGAHTDKRPGSTDTPLPYGDHAATTMSRFHAALAGWVDVTIHEHGAPEPDPTAPAMIRHILGYTTPLRRHTQAAEFATDVAGWHRILFAAINRPEYRKVDAGPCPETVDGEPCHGKVALIVPAEDLHQPPYAICEPSIAGVCVCGREWDTTQFVRLGMRIERRQDAMAAAERLAKAIAS